MSRLEKVSIHPGQFRLDNVDLEIPTGHYAVLTGRTGCGKTTLLEAICGLRTLAGGRIFLLDQEVTHLQPGARGIGYAVDE